MNDRPLCEVPPRLAAAAVLALGVLLLAPAALASPLDDAKDAEAQRAFGDAADLYAHAIETDPTNRDAVLGLGRATAAAGRWDLFGKAEVALRKLYEADRDDLEVGLVLARLYLERAPTLPQQMFRAAIYARARAHYTQLVASHPDLAEAVLGLARTHHGAGETERALAGLNAYLTRKPEAAALILFEKGRILYQQAQKAHKAAGGGYPLPQEVRRLYSRAQGACLSSTAADPTSFDAWMHVGWASQVLGDTETALQAYERAYSLDPESALPLKGIVALHQHDPEAKAAALERLERLAPERRRMRLATAYDLVAAKKWDEVFAFFPAYIEEFGEDADAVYCLGKAHEGQHREKDAVTHYERALTLNDEHLQAAEELDRRLRRHAIQRARNSVSAAHGVLADYQRLLDLAPRNPYVRNNAGFALREAWNHHKADPAWRKILFQSARLYEEAARLIGPWRPEKEAEIPWAQRYAYAQIINDAGIIFHVFAPTRDHERAERYYVRALEYVNWGYADAWTYLQQIYEEQMRWQDLHDLAEKCAQGLSSEKGEPLEKPREQARALADKLVADGKAR